MEAKQFLVNVLCLFLLAIQIGCSPDLEANKIIDDSNSVYSGQNCYGTALSGRYLVRWADGKTTLFLGERTELERVIEAERKKGARQILRVEQDRLFQSREVFAVGKNLGLTKSSSEGLFWQVWGQEAIEAPHLWDQEIKGEGVTIAIIDGGIDINHLSLYSRVAQNEREIPSNNIDDDKNGLVDDTAGYDFAYKKPEASPTAHGTHVAGIIAAEGKNGAMVGIAPRAKILPLNMMYESGGGTLSAAVFALKYAQSRGVKIVNASWGGAVCAETLGKTIQEIGDAGILFVTAAGNDGNNIDLYPEFPAAFNFKNQITVGASVQSGLMAAFSNFGRHSVHILAPGYQILSTVPEGWQMASGTSMAAPFVTGLAALLWSAHPQATLDDIRSSILSSVETPREYFPVLAGGVVNAPRALEYLRNRLQPHIRSEMEH